MFALIIFLPSYMNTSLSLRVFIFTIYIYLIWIFNAKILSATSWWTETLDLRLNQTSMYRSYTLFFLISFRFLFIKNMPNMWSGWTSNAHLWDMKLATHQPRKSKSLHLSFYYNKMTYTGREQCAA